MFDLGTKMNRNPLRRRLPRVVGYYTSVVDCRRLEGAVVIEAGSRATQIEIPEDRGLK